ncbi:MAG: flagellar motor protein MotA [Bacteroidetes bacterium QH_8_67_23]|nr:MAG: flagellar motor protein MotA [Bacteroidetes bacterium QH_8_67_23]
MIDALTTLPHSLAALPGHALTAGADLLAAGPDLFLAFQQAEGGGGGDGLVNLLVERFNEGNSEGPFMWPVLICLIIGLGIAFERIITLNLADINTRKFIVKVKRALEEGGVPAAEEVCASRRGPVASVFQAGLLRADEGIDAVEKAVVSYGSIEMSFLERGLVWLSLFISVAPMLGFLGTVIGMIAAFDAIEQAGDISPQLVAGGIKVALLTTAFGLIVAVILQFFYNYAVSKIDRIVVEMEDASVELIDSLVLMDKENRSLTEGRSATTSGVSRSSSDDADAIDSSTTAKGERSTAGDEPGDDQTQTSV